MGLSKTNLYEEVWICPEETVPARIVKARVQADGKARAVPAKDLARARDKGPAEDRDPGKDKEPGEVKAPAGVKAPGKVPDALNNRVCIEH